MTDTSKSVTETVCQDEPSKVDQVSFSIVTRSKQRLQTAQTSPEKKLKSSRSGRREVTIKTPKKDLQKLADGAKSLLTIIKTPKRATSANLKSRKVEKPDKQTDVTDEFPPQPQEYLWENNADWQLLPDLNPFRSSEYVHSSVESPTVSVASEVSGHTDFSEGGIVSLHQQLFPQLITYDTDLPNVDSAVDRKVNLSDTVLSDTAVKQHIDCSSSKVRFNVDSALSAISKTPGPQGLPTDSAENKVCLKQNHTSFSEVRLQLEPEIIRSELPAAIFPTTSSPNYKTEAFLQLGAKKDKMQIGQSGGTEDWEQQRMMDAEYRMEQNNVALQRLNQQEQTVEHQHRAAMQDIDRHKRELQDAMAVDRRILGLPLSVARADKKKRQNDSDSEEEDKFNQVLQKLTTASINDAGWMPKPFNGTKMGSDTMDRWINKFNDYASFKHMDNRSKVELFKLLMVDDASDWIRGKELDDDTDFDTLIQQFREQFQLSGYQKFQRARELWERKQQPNETADHYITLIKNRAKDVPLITDQQVVYIIMSGLKPDLRKQIMKGKHDTIEQVRNAARIIENADREGGTDSDTNAAVAELQKKIDKLVAKFDAQPTAAVLTQVAPAQQLPYLATQVTGPPQICYSDYGPMTNTAVKEQFFEQNNAREDRRQRPQVDRQRRSATVPGQQSQQQYQQRSQFYGGPRDQGRGRQQYSDRCDNYASRGMGYRRPQQQQGRFGDNGPPRNQNRFQQREQSPGYTPSSNESSGRNCRNCGREHPPRQCLAYGKPCFNCGRNGHFTRFCRQRQNLHDGYRSE